MRLIPTLFALALVVGALTVNSASQALVERDNDIYDYILDDRLHDNQTAWVRIKRSFYMRLPPKNNKWVAAEIKRYQRSPRYLEKLLTYSAPYLYYIIEELRKNGMPPELALLPVVESGYDPFAYSAGRASGIWQFIGSTARAYNLKIDWWYDGRRDVVKSTEAAIAFLKDLNGYSRGNWFYTLAAYNAGWSTVSKNIDKNRRQNKAVDFWSLKLPKETRAYVPRFFALVHIIRDHEYYGINLPPIPNRPVISFVNVGSQIDLARAADLSGITVSVMYKLNAGYSRWATPPQGPHVLTTLATHETIFVEAIRALDKTERMKWHEHKVQPGDSLSVLADRYDTTVRQLTTLNELENEDRIKINENIIIPSSIYPAANYTYSSVARKARRFRRARAGTDQTKKIHVVDKKESLWSIAKKYNIKLHSDIARWNKIGSRDILRPGQKLILFIPNDVGAPSIMEERAPIMRKIKYRVRRNDSPSSIARRFKVKLKDLYKWNKLDSKAVIHPDDKILLYVNVTETR